MAEQPHGNQHRRQRSIPQIRLEQPLPALPLLPAPVSPVTPRIRIQIPEEWEPYQDEPSEGEERVDEGMVGIRNGSARIQRRVRPQPNNGLLSPVTPRSTVRSPSRMRAPESQPYRDDPRDMSISPNTPTIGISQCPSLASSDSSRRSSASAPAFSPAGADADKPPGYEPMYDYLRSRPPPEIQFRTSPSSNTFLSPTSLPQSPVDFVHYTDEERPFVITLSPLSPHTRGEQPLPPPSYEELFLQHSCPQQRGELELMVQDMNSRGESAEEMCKFLIGMLILVITIVAVGTAFNWGVEACDVIHKGITGQC